VSARILSKLPINKQFVYQATYDYVILSYSSLRALNQCPKQYFYNYVLRLPSRESDYASKGRKTHDSKVLQAFSNKSDDDPERFNIDTSEPPEQIVKNTSSHARIKKQKVKEKIQEKEKEISTEEIKEQKKKPIVPPPDTQKIIEKEKHKGVERLEEETQTLERFIEKIEKKPEKIETEKEKEETEISQPKVKKGESQKKSNKDVSFVIRLLDDKIIVEGAFDLLHEKDGLVVLEEVKANIKDHNYEQSLYRLQMLTYTWAYFHENNIIPHKVQVISANSEQKPIIYKFTQADFDSFEVLLREKANFIRNGVFYSKPSKHNCNFCNFKDVCPDSKAGDYKKN